MAESPFSPKSLDKAIQDADPYSVDVGVECDAGESPSFTIDAEGEHTIRQVDVTWGAWAKTKFTKASTAVGAKLGLRW